MFNHCFCISESVLIQQEQFQVPKIALSEDPLCSKLHTYFLVFSVCVCVHVKLWMTFFFVLICIIFAGIKYYHSGRRGRKINQSFLSIGPSIVVLLIFYIRTYKFIISSKTLVLLAICFIANVNWANRGRKINQVYRSNGASIVVILILCTLNTKIFISIIYTWFSDFHF